MTPVCFTQYVLFSYIISLLTFELCHVFFMWCFFCCWSCVFMSYLFSCMSWLRAFHTDFPGAIWIVWKEHVCTISSPLQKHCCSLQNFCFSLHKDATHIDNDICCCSSICTTSSVPQILLLVRALSSEVAMQNHLWLSLSTQLSMAPNLFPTCQGMCQWLPVCVWHVKVSFCRYLAHHELEALLFVSSSSSSSLLSSLSLLLLSFLFFY